VRKGRRTETPPAKAQTIRCLFKIKLAGETGLTGEFIRVSIFMSVFDVHINRSPVAGTVRRVAYVPGKFLNADLDKASEDNERNALVVAADGGRIGVVQIAGLIARRIVCWTKEGQAMSAGERIGMIRFGSRVDVYLPSGTVPLVSEGQTSLAGETVIAEIGATPQSRSFRLD